MPLWKRIRRTLGSRRFRGTILDCIVEARVGVWGEQFVLVNGARVAHDPWAWLSGAKSHFFVIEDGAGEKRNIEVVFHDRSGGLAVSMYVNVLIDGELATRLDEADWHERPSVCPHCGYSLAGIPPENKEIRCPECGRHTPAFGHE